MGFSIFVALTVPQWARNEQDVIDTGSIVLNHVIKIILESELILGFTISVFLDNTLPGELTESSLKTFRPCSEFGF